jgi:hypothetical protein
MYDILVLMNEQGNYSKLKDIKLSCLKYLPYILQQQYSNLDQGALEQ